MIVLHVGPHKTATTWLQANFHANRRALLAKGWLYPSTGERVRTAHHDLSDRPAEILDPKSRKVAELRKIGRQAGRDGLNVLLSSEGFRHWKPKHIKALRTILGDAELHVVYAVRDPVSLLNSFWAQQVKSGAKASLPAFLDKQFQKNGKTKLLAPVKELRRYRRLPRTRLTVLAYDEIRRQNRDIFDVFQAEILHIDGLEKIETGSANERQPIEMTEFMRMLVIRTGRWKGRERVNVGRAFQYLLTEGARNRILEAMQGASEARRTIVVERDQPALHVIERKLLKAYRDRMIPAPAGETLFLTGPEIFVYYDEAALEANPAVGQLLDEMQQRFRPDGPLIRLAEWAQAGLQRWRRFLKLFR